MNQLYWIFVALLLGQGLFFSPQIGENDPLFADVTAEVGLTNNRRGDERAIGQAWGDFDNDGWVDLYLTDPAGPNSLYRNITGTHFERIEDPAVYLNDAYSGGAIFIDYDNDGWRDLYVVNWGENKLLRNDGGRFVDVTTAAGVGGGERNSQTASWGDYDQDGFLDLYVANWSCYPQCGRPSTGEGDKFFHNEGDGTFRDVTSLLSDKITGAGFVASFTDYDDDGDPDLYLVNDEFINPVGNALWRNDGPGCDGWCFTELSQAAGADTTVMGMGLATADYDNDGDVDFYFSNAGPMTLLQNQGDGTFVDQANAAGVDTPSSVGWGSLFFDFDNDGWQDLYLAVSAAASGQGTSQNKLFHNLGNGSFADVSPISGADHPGATLGAATADYNHDGRIDLVIGNIDSGYVLYKNQSAAAQSLGWFTLELVGQGPINRDGVGSRVWVTTANGQTQRQEVIAGASLGAGHELALHFGVGTHQKIERLVIDWPDGRRQVFDDVPINQKVKLKYTVDNESERQQRLALYSKAGSPISLPIILGLLVALGLFIGGVYQLQRPSENSR